MTNQDNSINAEAGTVCTAFSGSNNIASGELRHVILAVKSHSEQNSLAQILVFDDSTGALIDIDIRGTIDDVLQRLSQPDRPTPAGSDSSPTTGPGRPKLGVVAREVTLLPRHWDWLNRQPGGASVALRKLVEEARRDSVSKDKIRQSQEATYRFLSAMAGDFTNFEEATRALFAGNRHRFESLIDSWSPDVRDYAKRLAVDALQDEHS